MWRTAVPRWPADSTPALLATAVELLDENNRMFFQAHAKKNAKWRKPIQITRPGDDAPRKRLATPAETARFFKGRIRVKES